MPTLIIKLDGCFHEQFRYRFGTSQPPISSSNSGDVQSIDFSVTFVRGDTQYRIVKAPVNVIPT